MTRQHQRSSAAGVGSNLWARFVRSADRRAFDVELRALLTRVPFERFSEQLAEHPSQVLRTCYRRSGQRVRFELVGGEALTLRLYWRRAAEVARLISMRSDDRTGWIVDARTSAGDAVTYYAWLATLEIGASTYTG